MVGEVKSFRKSAGPLEVYGYHDYPSRPAHSPLYVGVWVGKSNAEVRIPPYSRLRPFSGGN